MVHNYRFVRADFKRCGLFKKSLRKLNAVSPEVNPFEALKPEPSETEKKRKQEEQSSEPTRTKKHKKIKIDFGF